MKKYLIGLKKRGQIILLCGNLLLTCVNLWIVSNKLDNLGNGMVLYCQVVNFTDTICQEMK